MTNLNELLLRREQRAYERQQLIDRYKKSLISFHLNIPGQEKDKLLYKVTLIEGLNELKKFLDRQKIELSFERIEFLSTGPEAVILVDTDCYFLKELMIIFESMHPLGRVFDLDVYNEDGIPISRSEMGFEERKCYVCDDFAKVCARSKRHDINVVIEAIDNIMTDFHSRSHREI